MVECGRVKGARKARGRPKKAEVAIVAEKSRPLLLFTYSFTRDSNGIVYFNESLTFVP